MAAPDYKYKLQDNGILCTLSGVPFVRMELNDINVFVHHLQPHVESIALDGVENVSILISYSSHCWTCKKSESNVDWQCVTIWDHKRPRSYEPTRHETSFHLPDLMRDISLNKIYVTPSDRNYGCYNATLTDHDGQFYTAYFTVKADKGRFDGMRHTFRIFVESAYPKNQPVKGSKTSFRAIIGQARLGKTVKYRRP